MTFSFCYETFLETLVFQTALRKLFLISPFFPTVFSHLQLVYFSCHIRLCNFTITTTTGAVPHALPFNSVWIGNTARNNSQKQRKLTDFGI